MKYLILILALVSASSTFASDKISCYSSQSKMTCGFLIQDANGNEVKNVRSCRIYVFGKYDLLNNESITIWENEQFSETDNKIELFFELRKVDKLIEKKINEKIDVLRQDLDVCQAF